MTTFNYEEWLAQVPESIKLDPLWNFKFTQKPCYSPTWYGKILTR